MSRSVWKGPFVDPSLLKKVEKLILPLLHNLMKNPENEYIKWPGRTTIVQKQINKIVAITRGV